MTTIPKNHPRAKSLLIREKLVRGFHQNIVAKEGLLAHGRGETFDYLIGEKTNDFAIKSIRAAASSLILAKKPVISVNGNVAALCPKEIVTLGKVVNAKIEVNLFYDDDLRRKNIVKLLNKYNKNKILGQNKNSLKSLANISSARKFVDKEGIFAADLVLVPLEDGDRALALRKAGKKIITFDLNPLSRTAQNSDITIVDNIVRGIKLLIEYSNRLSKKNPKYLEKILQKYDNKRNLSEAILHIKRNLERRARNA